MFLIQFFIIIFYTLLYFDLRYFWTPAKRYLFTSDYKRWSNNFHILHRIFFTEAPQVTTMRPLSIFILFFLLLHGDLNLTIQISWHFALRIKRLVFTIAGVRINLPTVTIMLVSSKTVSVTVRVRWLMPMVTSTLGSSKTVVTTEEVLKPTLTEASNLGSTKAANATVRVHTL